jgi:hypothetical protein
MGDRLREAEKLCKEATKLTTPSLLSFRLKGEWEQATPLWERAAMLFRVGESAAPLQGRDTGCIPPPAAACGGAAAACGGAAAAVSPNAVPPDAVPPTTLYAPPCMCSNAASWGVPRNATSARARGTSGSAAAGTPPSSSRRLESLQGSWGSGRRWRLTTAGQQSCLQRRVAPRRQQRRRREAPAPWRSSAQWWAGAGLGCSGGGQHVGGVGGRLLLLQLFKPVWPGLLQYLCTP